MVEEMQDEKVSSISQFGGIDSAAERVTICNYNWYEDSEDVFDSIKLSLEQSSST